MNLYIHIYISLVVVVRGKSLQIPSWLSVRHFDFVSLYNTNIYLIRKFRDPLITVGIILIVIEKILCSGLWSIQDMYYGILYSKVLGGSKQRLAIRIPET